MRFILFFITIVILSCSTMTTVYADNAKSDNIIETAPHYQPPAADLLPRRREAGLADVGTERV